METVFVYCIFGLGIGDDEDAWELSSVHTTRAKAEARIAENNEDDLANDYGVIEYKIEDMPLE